jgi:hypothetical protein
LYPKGTLCERVDKDGDTAALRALDDHLASTERALYRVRRVFPAARTDSCRERHGDSCPSPWPGWGTHEQVAHLIRCRAREAGGRIEESTLFRRRQADMRRQW